ncbi:MAG: hypothetical protein JNJ71_19910 [Rubrivivax sp.]|nr:hypothetical protein [Rubrivivax sp.]
MQSPPTARPTAAEDVLRHASELLAPLVQLLMHHGVDYPRFAAAMKRVFVEVALQEMGGTGSPTHTAVGLLTGLQRRDVKALRDDTLPRWPAKALSPTLPMQAVTRWANDPRYNDTEGRALPLPLRASGATGDGPSFEELVTGLSKDMHVGALLDELVRLGLARNDDGLVTLVQPDFVPARDAPQLLAAMARNTHDHLAAAVANLLAGKPQFLEYSLVADELRPESVAELHELARKIWSSGYRRSVQAATHCVERDRAQGFGPGAPEMRIRFGTYFFSEPVRREGESS